MRRWRCRRRAFERRCSAALEAFRCDRHPGWTALDLFGIEVSERGNGVGTSLMEVFIDIYPEYEVLLNSDPKVQDFYRRFSFTDYNKTQHKRPKQYKTMNPSTSSRLMIRTETSKNTAIKLPQIREHLNPLHQFLDENNEIPEIYPAYNENHLRIFYSANSKKIM